MKKNRKRKYFRKYDIIVYSFFAVIFISLGIFLQRLGNEKPSKAEIYVDGALKFVYPLIEHQRDVFVETNLGGVNVRFKDNMVRVTASNSPLKLCVKQGWIKEPGDMIVGIPDRLLIKIVGEKQDNELDYVIR